MLPPDACPYPKPFPRDFDDCPAFQPRPFMAIDMRYQPLPPSWTCRHLQVARRQEAPHGYYSVCAIGDATARGRWARERAARVMAATAVWSQVLPVVQRQLAELWVAKAEQLKAMRMQQDPEAWTREMERLVDGFRPEIRRLLEEQSRLLGSAAISIDACIVYMEALWSHAISQVSTEDSWEVPQDVVDLFPEELHPLLRNRPA